MYAPTEFVYPLISSLVAAVAIMLSSEIIEHNLEWKHAIIMAVVANVATTFATPVFGQIIAASLAVSLPVIAGISLLTLAIDLLFWVLASALLMSESFMNERIKIAVYGFFVTQIAMYFLPMLGLI
ncbi:MAG: hypothetical protein ACP5E4_03600 [Candidatus Aenigmatarchaeota archaeon]